MALVQNELYLDITRAALNTVYCSQYDDGSREIVITLLHDSEIFEVDEYDGKKYFYRLHKPDNTYIWKPCSVKNGKLIITLDKNHTAVAGKAKCEIEIVDIDDNVLTTPVFYISISKAGVTDNEIKSKDDLQVINDLLKNYNKNPESTRLNMYVSNGVLNISDTGHSVNVKNGILFL